MSDPLERARAFLAANGRILERHRFETAFFGASGAPVAAALAAYRTEGGLYGHGLEPDKRAGDPQPIDQAVALEIMVEADLPRDLARSLAEGLSGLTTSAGGLPFSHPSVAGAPHAPWWTCDAPQPANLNPTGEILAYLWRLGVDHAWMGPAEAFCWSALDGADIDEPHGLAAALSFLGAAPDRDRSEAACAALTDRVRGAVALEPGAEGYVFSPLTLAHGPDSPGARYFGEAEISRHLDHALQAQGEDGGWSINWPPISAGVEVEGRGIVTLKTCLTLRAWGRL